MYQARLLFPCLALLLLPSAPAAEPNSTSERDAGTVAETVVAKTDTPAGQRGDPRVDAGSEVRRGGGGHRC